MKFSRREFIQIGTAGAVFAAGCGSDQAKAPAQAQGSGPGSGGPELQMDIEGFYIIEGVGAATQVRMIDGPKVGVTTHTLQLRARADAIDAATATPDAAHIKQIGTDTFWFWDLAGLDVSMPKADSGSDVLTRDETSGDDGQEMPPTDQGWHSMVRVPDLKALCGASHVTNLAAVASTVALKHGHLTVLPPEGVGAGAIWNFHKNDGTQLARRAVSNKVRYTRQNNGNQLVVEVGSQKIYFKKGVTTQLLVTNRMPSAPGGCPDPCTPNMDHFSAFLQMVDKQFDCAVSLASFTPKKLQNADPDYCPGSQVAP